MIEITREIEGAQDFELDRPRTSPLAYDATWPQEGEAPGLVLIIPGFGADTNPEYARGLRRHVLETTGMAAVSVRYHAIESRPDNGGALTVEANEQLRLIGLAALHKAPVKDYANLQSLAEGLATLKADIWANAWIEPGRGEYQNFGVVQALDHLAVIGDLIENAPAFDTSRIVAMGSSHGGYIAQLIAKIAPSTLAAVIDNSSYVQPPMNYMAIGERAEHATQYVGLRLEAKVRSGWTVSDREAPNFYGRDQDLIRDLGFPPHVRTMRAASADGGTQYFMVNATQDRVSPPAVKQRQQTALSRAGFAADLAMIGPDQIDGRVFKVMTHGLDCSLKGLFDRYIDRVVPRQTSPDALLGGVITYDCVDRGYRFTHCAEAPYVQAETYDLHAWDEEAAAEAAAA